MCNRYIFFLHLTFDLEYINPRIKYKSVDLLNYKQFYLKRILIIYNCKHKYILK